MSDFRILRLSAIHLVILHGFFSEFVIVFHLSKSYNIIGTILGYGYDVLSYEYISNLFLLNLIGIYDILMNFVNELLASAVNCQCLNQTFLDIQHNYKIHKWDLLFSSSLYLSRQYS